MVRNGVTFDNDNASDYGGQHYCCKEFLRFRRNRSITEHTSSYTADKYYCVIDGFGFSILANILYCPFCGSKLVGW
jgi:hypothetical protein